MTDPAAKTSALSAETVELIRDLAETVHQTGSLRDHADPNDRTGWNVHGIETCADPLCVAALALLATLDAARTDYEARIAALEAERDHWKRVAFGSSETGNARLSNALLATPPTAVEPE